MGEFSGDHDEGMRNASFYYSKLLAKNNKILTLDIRYTFNPKFWKEIKEFNPSIIHYIHGPTIKSLFLLKMMKHYCSKSKIIVSAMRPSFTILSEKMIPFFSPDMILTQSISSEYMFKKRNVKTKFLPSGVDINRFVPCSSENKIKFKKQYEIDSNKFVILHIGSIKDGRNIRVLKSLQNNGNQVIIVGAISPGIDFNLVHELKLAGCMVWEKYFEKVEELYFLADCYVFPTVDRKNSLGQSIADSIEMPLTVLESMSCNLPVIATKFGALPRAFEEKEGLFFVNGDENEFVEKIEIIKNNMFTLKTREQVLKYSWENIVDTINKMYLELTLNKLT